MDILDKINRVLKEGREEEKRNLMIEYLLGVEAHSGIGIDREGTREEFESMETDELERTYETYGGIVSELDSLVESNDSSTPSREEMIQYLLDSNALFHHDEGTRQQWETMNLKDLKVYYDDYKASE